jgi:hypothetical protein
MNQTAERSIECAVRRVWCTACNAATAAAVEELGAAVAAQLGVTGLALAHELKRRRPDPLALLAKGVGAFALAKVVTAAIPQAQRLVCGTCGCSHVSELRAGVA